ncbi:MAG TPA: hypothetical protein VJR29_08780 [bacterium]|nr:hypothetical protein [bacterium]
MNAILSKYVGLALALWLGLASCSQKSSAPAGEEVSGPQAPAQEAPADDDEELSIILDERKR